MCWEGTCQLGLLVPLDPTWLLRPLVLKIFWGEKQSWLLGPIFPPELTQLDSKAL